jgi:hypothetical protein
MTDSHLISLVLSNHEWIAPGRINIFFLWAVDATAQQQ